MNRTDMAVARDNITVYTDLIQKQSNFILYQDVPGYSTARDIKRLITHASHALAGNQTLYADGTPVDDNMLIAEMADPVRVEFHGGLKITFHRYQYYFPLSITVGDVKYALGEPKLVLLADGVPQSDGTALSALNGKYVVVEEIYFLVNAVCDRRRERKNLPWATPSGNEYDEAERALKATNYDVGKAIARLDDQPRNDAAYYAMIQPAYFGGTFVDTCN